MSQDSEGTLVILTCHVVLDPESGAVHGEHPEDRPIYEAQVLYAWKHLQWRAATNPLLVISGGETKLQRRCSEARSYLDWAQHGLLSIPENVALEEWAMTSIENLLLSCYVYHQVRHRYPANIEVISWGFKQRRFEKTLEAINRWAPLGQQFPSLSFFPVGDLSGKGRAKAVEREEAYIRALEAGIDAYYTDPDVMRLIEGRDVYHSRTSAKVFYSDYPLPF